MIATSMPHVLTLFLESTIVFVIKDMLEMEKLVQVVKYESYSANPL